MAWFYITLALVGGLLIPVQAGINIDLAGRMQSSVLSALVSFFVGTAALLVYSLIQRAEWPSFSSAASYPVWIWMGGLCGAYLVWASIFVGPKIGATTLVALLIVGQMTGSLLLDHYGGLGFAVREISVGRIAGVLLLVIGALMIKKY